MASCPITSWQIDGETMKTVRNFIFLGSQITADISCSHEIKRHLLLGRKVMTNLDSILKSRDITLLTKVRLVKAVSRLLGRTPRLQACSARAESPVCRHISTFPVVAALTLQFLFTFCHKGGVICISKVIDISPNNLGSSLCFSQPSISHDVLCI